MPSSHLRPLVRLPSVRREPFERVVERYGAVVLRVCRAVAGADAADDAWSETFLSALRAYPDLPEGSNVEAWLVSIGYRKAIDQRRAERRRPTPIGAVAEEANTKGGPDGWEPDLGAALAQLPDKQRQSVAYHHLAGLSYHEVAAIVGGSVEAARKAASDGIARLRRIMQVKGNARQGAP